MTLLDWPLAVPTLTDGSVMLRGWIDEDADAVYAACQDAEIQRWMDIPVPYLLEHAIQFIGEQSAGQWSSQQGAPFAITCPANGGVLRGSTSGQRDGWSGQCVRKLFTVGRCPVGGQDTLDRQLEQWSQTVGDLLSGDVSGERLWRDLQPAAEVRQRVADNDHAQTLNPEDDVVACPAREHLDAKRQPVSRCVQVHLALGAVIASQPGEIGAARASLLQRDAVLADEILGGVRRGGEHQQPRTAKRRDTRLR